MPKPAPISDTELHQLISLKAILRPGEAFASSMKPEGVSEARPILAIVSEQMVSLPLLGDLEGVHLVQFVGTYEWSNSQTAAYYALSYNYAHRMATELLEARKSRAFLEKLVKAIDDGEVSENPNIKGVIQAAALVEARGHLSRLDGWFALPPTAPERGDGMLVDEEERLLPAGITKHLEVKAPPAGRPPTKLEVILDGRQLASKVKVRVLDRYSGQPDRKASPDSDVWETFYHRKDTATVEIRRDGHRRPAIVNLCDLELVEPFAASMLVP